ncbi:MAG: TRAP transporter TatT component family protein, partial [Woeseiaceae bacterium]
MRLQGTRGEPIRPRGVIRRMSTSRGFELRTGLFACVGVCFSLSGCASLISSAASGLADNLSAAVLNQNDPQTVKDGAPAYLLLLDSFLEGSPDDPALLSAAANLYASYGAVFADDDERAARLTDKGRSYGFRAICISYDPACDWRGMLFDTFEASLHDLSNKHADVIWSYSFASLAYIEAHSDESDAIAEVPYTEALLERYLEISDTSNGTAYAFLGILACLIPPGFGGEPDKGMTYFERAIDMSRGRDLGAKVDYARYCARLVYDRELHDRLLTEVLQ